MRCIQVINPNTSQAMTETIGAAARAAAAPDTEILAVCPAEGAPSIEGHFDEAIAAIGVLEQVKAGCKQGALAWPRPKPLSGRFQFFNQE
jgi:allantoin racemase